MPLSNLFVKVCIVDSKTPCLISNNVFRTLGAQINTATDHVSFSKLNIRMPLSLPEKDFCELVRLGNDERFTGEGHDMHGDCPIMSNEDAPAFEPEVLGDPNQNNMKVNIRNVSVEPNASSQFSGSVSDPPPRSSTVRSVENHNGQLQPCRSLPSSDLAEKDYIRNIRRCRTRNGPK